MTPRERFRRVCRHKKVDHIPYGFSFAGPRGSTFSAWRKQGLSKEQQERWYEFIGQEAYLGDKDSSFCRAIVIEER